MNKFSIWIIGAILLLSSCQSKYNDIFAEGKMRLTKESILFKSSGVLSSLLQISGSNTWKLDNSQTADWCSVEAVYDYNGDYVVIIAQPNRGTKSRKTSFRLVSDFDSREIPVSQLGSDPEILVNKDDVINRSSTKTVVVLEILSNIDFTMKSEAPEWLKIETEYVNDETPVRIILENNSTDLNREANLVFTEKDGEYVKKILFRQSKNGEVVDYTQEDVSKMNGNRMLKITGSLTDEKTVAMDKPLSLSYDNDRITRYQSVTMPLGTDIVLEYQFTGENSLDYLTYRPYAADDTKAFGQTEIWTKSVGEDYVHQLTYNFAGAGAQTVVFSNRIVNPERVKFVVKNSYNNKDLESFVVACAEMEFYSTAMEYANIFTDATYSALKAGVTFADIAKMDSDFFRNIAEYLYNGTYPLIRIRSYNSYNAPAGETYVRKRQSELDNYTGISVKKGESIVVMSDNILSKPVSLLLLGTDPIANGALNTKSFALYDGVTKITADFDGLLYVKYFAETASDPITVHIAGGTVNGYCNVYENMNEGLTMLDRAVSPLFDVVGKYVHLILPTAKLRENKATLQALIEKYDRIVELNREFIGIETNGKNFKHRTTFMLGLGSDESKAKDFVLLNRIDADAYLNPALIKDNILWDLASNISRSFHVSSLGWLPASRDLNTLYVQKVMENKNQLDIEKIYSPAATEFIIEYQPLADTDDTDLKSVVPFWQIYLYMNDVKGNPDFYKTLFGKNKAKTLSTDFTREVNRTSAVDFGTFFTSWNFPKDRTPVVLPEKITPTLHFICNANVECFKGNKIASASTYQVSGKTVSLFAAENIVGLEVVDSGILSLVYGTTFILDIEKPSLRIFALGPKGEKFELSKK